MLSQKPIIEFEEGTLVTRHVSSQTLERMSAQGIWKWDTRAGVWRSDAFHYARILELLQNMAGQALPTPAFSEIENTAIAESVAPYHSHLPSFFDDRVPKWQPLSFSKSLLPPLRSEQKGAIEHWLKYIRVGLYNNIY